MNKPIFETHLLNTSSLPFIFHLNTVNQSLSSSCNWHPNIEILFFIEGSATASCSTDRYFLQKGDILVINSDVPHIINSESSARYYCLILDNQFCKALSVDTESVYFKPHIQDKHATALYEQVITAFRDRRAYREAAIKHAVFSLLLYIAKFYTEKIVPKKELPEKDEGIRLAIGYIRAHLTDPLPLETLAAEAGMSKYYFVREFKKVTGDTPVTFIQKNRCESAKKLLLENVCSVQKVSEQCGFESLSYFGRIFKKYTGCTPSEYRKATFL